MNYNDFLNFYRKERITAKEQIKLWSNRLTKIEDAYTAMLDAKHKQEKHDSGFVKTRPSESVCDIWISSVQSSVPCAICEGNVFEFSIPNDIWNRVVRENGIETDKEYLCLQCFLNTLRCRLGIDVSNTR